MTRPLSRNSRINLLSLWCVFMVSALLLANLEADSIKSGLKVPWAKNTSSDDKFNVLRNLSAV